jgi:hypothetical protein
MALGEYRPVALADEKQHLGEMVVIIKDRKDWELHTYWHFQSLFQQRRLCSQRIGSLSEC